MAEYIEKKDALEAISKIEFIAMDCVAAAGVNDAFQLVVRYMEHQLKKLPAADVRPVVRGKWIPYYEDFDGYDGGVEKRQWGFECSICGRWEENAEPFCNCGADMRPQPPEEE